MNSDHQSEYQKSNEILKISNIVNFKRITIGIFFEFKVTHNDLKIMKI